MLGRRMLLFAALLFASAALAAALAPRELRRPATKRPPSATTGPQQVTRGRRPLAATLEGRAVTASLPRGLQRRGVVVLHVGDLLDLSVSASRPDTVAIAGYDRFVPVDPDTPARFEFVADRAGRFDVRLTDSNRVVGRLDVRPAPIAREGKKDA